MKRQIVKQSVSLILMTLVGLIMINSVVFAAYYIDCFWDKSENNPIYINEALFDNFVKPVNTFATFIEVESESKKQASVYVGLMDIVKGSDINIRGAHYTTAGGMNYMDGFRQLRYDPRDLDWYVSAIDTAYISKPYVDPFNDQKMITVSKRIEDKEGVLLGVFGVDYDYLYFEQLAKSTLPVNYKNTVLLRIKDYNGKEFTSLSIPHSNYYFDIETDYWNDMKENLNHFSPYLWLILILFVFSASIFVRKNLKISETIGFDMEANYYKGQIGGCLIDEYHQIMSGLESIKEDIDRKYLKISEYRVKENDLIQEIRHKTKQYEELYKNNSVLKNKDIFLKSFFDNISNNMDQMVWIASGNGEIIYLNEVLKEVIKIDSSVSTEKMSDFLEGFDDGLGILMERDFKAIKFTFKNHLFSESLNGMSIRIREFNRVGVILCICSKSNFEDKMNQNYMKKSRDLHFINEIGKITGSNNSIETTLQEVLDKVAFLANLNLSTIRLINDSNHLELKTVSGYSNEYLMEKELTIQGNHIGYSFNENKIILINHVEDLLFPEARIEKILAEGRAVAIIPLANYQKSFGVMTIVSDYKFNTDYLVLLESISINVTISLEKVLLFDQLKANYFKTVEAFVTAAEIKQERFSGHSRRVAKVSQLIAERLYLNDSEIDDIYITGLLHDIGKLGFADNSLEYFFDIDDHGTMGRHMIENVGFERDILEGIEFHHLNYDLSNLEEVSLQEQPYYAQIIRLANDFDLYMNYSNSDLDGSAFTEKMLQDSGRLYSPQLLKILGDIIKNQNEQLMSIYVASNTGENYED